MRTPGGAAGHQPGDYLLISDAGSLACNTAEVPEEPTIVNTLVGTLIRKDDETGRETFILNRTLPQGVSHPGAFFPADGCAEFTVTDHGPTLTVSGRHAHCIDPSDGQVKHQPEPIPAPEKGATWLFDAVQFAKPALATHEAVGEDA